MGHHYTKTTVSADAYCKRCGKNTQHAVSDGRLTYCIDCYIRPLPVAAVVVKPVPERGLFDEVLQ